MSLGVLESSLKFFGGSAVVIVGALKPGVSAGLLQGATLDLLSTIQALTDHGPHTCSRGPSRTNAVRYPDRTLTPSSTIPLAARVE